MNKNTKLVAGLICGNEEVRIERCVKSLQQICDEIVIIRAIGALKPDETIKIAKSLGCHVGEYKNSPLVSFWEHLDNFGEARNLAFSAAYELAGKEGWVMWADCDDVIANHMVEPHKKMLAECKDEFSWIVTDYVIPEQNKRAPRERFFRYQSAWWHRPIHENAQPTRDIKAWIRRDLEILHQPPMGPRPSSERNRRILLHADRMTSHFKFYLHYENYIANKPEEAAKYGAEALSLADLDGVNRYETLMNCATLCSGEPALKLAKQAMELEPKRREAFGLAASIYLDEKKPKEALKIVRQMKEIPVPSFPQWTHRSEWYGWKADHLEQWCLRELGKINEADKAQKQILKKSDRPTISLIHATRGRPIQAIKCMNNWLGKAAVPERVEHIFVFDEDDKTSEILKRFRHEIQKQDGYSVGAWNLGAKASKGDILIQLSDDWEPPTHWDELIEMRMDTHQPQVLRISDGYRKDNLLCMAILTRKYYKKNGLFNPLFRNVYSDNDFTARAEKNGAVIDARDLVFIHHHPFFEGFSPDEIYARGNSAEEYKRAKEIFEGLHK